MTTDKRFVVDTNLIISRLLVPWSPSALAVRLAAETGVLLFSRDTFAEVAEVLMRPRFDPYIGPEERQKFLILLGRISREVIILRKVRACRDPKDDKILEVAVNGSADAILTGDKDLLVLDPYLGIPILTPSAFRDQGKGE